MCVIVLTPSLNKSFKFQSDWPYNNSQVYLIKSIIDDIKNDNEKNIIENDNGFQITTTVNYPNNRKLVRQTVTTDKDLNIKEVKVMDESDVTQMKMTFTSIDLSPSIANNAFNLDNVYQGVFVKDLISNYNKIEPDAWYNTRLDKEEKNMQRVSNIVNNHSQVMPIKSPDALMRLLKAADNLSLDGEKNFLEEIIFQPEVYKSLTRITN